MPCFQISWVWTSASNGPNFTRDGCAPFIVPNSAPERIARGTKLWTFQLPHESHLNAKAAESRCQPFSVRPDKWRRIRLLMDDPQWAQKLPKMHRLTTFRAWNRSNKTANLLVACIEWSIATRPKRRKL